jgi:hypothetical protein
VVGASDDDRDGVGGARWPFSYAAALMQLMGQPNAQLSDPLTDEEIDEKAWAISNILGTNKAERQAILKRVDELEKIIEKMFQSKYAHFTQDVDHIIETFDITGDTEEARLHKAFEIMRKTRSDLPEDDDTLVRTYRRHKQPLTTKRPKLLPRRWRHLREPKSRK